MIKNPSVKDYQDRLVRVGKAAAIAGFQSAIQGGREIGNAMKRAVPRDSGALADSIRMEIDPDNFRVWLKAGGPTNAAGSSLGDYALHQEFGTSEQPANPFFWPMWRAHRTAVRRRMTKAMKDAIQAAWQ